MERRLGTMFARTSQPKAPEHSGPHGKDGESVFSGRLSPGIWGGFDLTEPDDAKVSRPVLRGLGLSNGPRLPYFIVDKGFLSIVERGGKTPSNLFSRGVLDNAAIPRKWDVV